MCFPARYTTVVNAYCINTKPSNNIDMRDRYRAFIEMNFQFPGTSLLSFRVRNLLFAKIK